MSKTCWLVTTGSYSDYHVWAAFPTKVEARAFLAVHREHCGAWHSQWSDEDARVEERPWSPKLPAVPAGLRGWCVQMESDGAVTEAEHADTFAVVSGEPEEPFTYEATEDRDIDYRGARWRELASSEPPFSRQFYVLARDKEHAIKIANEHRAMLLAGPEPWPPPLPEAEPKPVREWPTPGAKQITLEPKR